VATASECRFVRQWHRCFLRNLVHQQLAQA